MSVEQIRRGGGPSGWSEVLPVALAVAYVGLPIGSVVWVLWATRPR